MQPALREDDPDLRALSQRLNFTLNLNIHRKPTGSKGEAHEI